MRGEGATPMCIPERWSKPGSAEAGGLAEIPARVPWCVWGVWECCVSPLPQPQTAGPSSPVWGWGWAKQPNLLQVLDRSPCCSCEAGKPHPLAWPEHHFGRPGLYLCSPSLLVIPGLPSIKNRCASGTGILAIWLTSHSRDFLIRRFGSQHSQGGGGVRTGTPPPPSLSPGLWDAPGQGLPAPPSGSSEEDRFSRPPVVLR